MVIGSPAWEALVAEFARRYANAATRRQYETELAGLFRFAGVEGPGALTESLALEWCGLPTANNTIRNRLSRLCMFLRWRVRQGEADRALVRC